MRIKKHIRPWVGLGAAALIVLVVGVSHAVHASGFTENHWTLVWKANGHSIHMEYFFATAVYQPWWVQEVDLSCSPEDAGYWDYSAKNHINGTELSWGGVPPSGNYYVHYAAPYGGNIKYCNTNYSINMDNNTSINSGNTLRLKYKFQTNFYDPSNDVSPTIIVDVGPSDGSGGGGVGSSCAGAVSVSGGGYLDSCIVDASTPY